ncbi:MAG: DinB family protein [Bacteroidota bacterium]
MDHLSDTYSELLTTVSRLSEEQLYYKTEKSSWSIAECVEHIAISENSLSGAFDTAMKTVTSPDSIVKAAMTDEQILGFIESRQQKVKTSEAFEPSGQFDGYEGSLNAFEAKRRANLDLVETSEVDMRNHFFDFPFAKMDAYQIILFMSGHAKRHTDQIKEIMAHEDFPTAE